MPKIESSRAQSASLSEHFQRPQLLLAVLCAFTFIVYSVSLSFQFVWDDLFQIADNPLIRSWSNIPTIFLSDLWHYTHRSQLYYRPLFTAWAVLNYSLFKLNPWGWHLTNILLHLAAVLVVYDAARRLRMSYWTAAAAATIFALHPIHIETIAWVSAASDTMVTIFYVLAFTAFLRFREAGQARPLFWRIASLVFLACALLTKEMALTFFAIVAVYVWLFPEEQHAGLARKLKAAALAAWPYAAITILYLFLRKYAMSSVVAPDISPVSAGQFLLTLPYVVGFYFRLLFFPVGLTGLYYTPYLTSANFAWAVVSVLALVAYAAAARYLTRKSGDRTIAFLALWPIFTLAPALYLPGFQDGDFIRDRYAYLPSVGFALFIAQALKVMPSLGKIKAQRLQLAALGATVAFFLAGSVQQGYWQNEHTVFERGYRLYPQNLYAKVGLARVLQREGDPERSIQLLTEATAAAPRWSKAHYLLAEAYSRVGKPAEGRRELSMAVALLKNPTEGELDAADLAGLYGRLGDYAEGERLCTAVLSSSPDLLTALYNCGVIEFQLGRYANAEKLLTQAVEQTPGEPSVLYWRGRVRMAASELPQAEQDLARASQIRTDVPDYHYWLAQSLQALGNIDAARQQYNATLELNPSYNEAKAKLQALGRSSTLDPMLNTSR